MRRACQRYIFRVGSDSSLLLAASLWHTCFSLPTQLISWTQLAGEFLHFWKNEACLPGRAGDMEESRGYFSEAGQERRHVFTKEQQAFFKRDKSLPTSTITQEILLREKSAKGLSFWRAKFLAFLGDHAADDSRGHRRNHSCRKTDQSDNARSQWSFLAFTELRRFSGASLAKQRFRHQRQHVPPWLSAPLRSLVMQNLLYETNSFSAKSWRTASAAWQTSLGRMESQITEPLHTWACIYFLKVLATRFCLSWKSESTIWQNWRNLFALAVAHI